jgi:hypothetical protein
MERIMQKAQNQNVNHILFSVMVIFSLLVWTMADGFYRNDPADKGFDKFDGAMLVIMGSTIILGLLSYRKARRIKRIFGQKPTQQIVDNLMDALVSELIKKNRDLVNWTEKKVIGVGWPQNERTQEIDASQRWIRGFEIQIRNAYQAARFRFEVMKPEQYYAKASGLVHDLVPFKH